MKKNLRIHVAYVAIILALCATPTIAATLTFTVPNAIANEIVLGMRARHYAQLAGETDTEYVRRVTRDVFWRQIVDEQRRATAATNAALTAPGDFGT